MDYLEFVLKASPFFGLFLVLFLRLEHRLTRIEVDITWIKKGLNGCPPNSEKNTP